MSQSKPAQVIQNRFEPLC
ncbi:hypothetical protein CPC197_1970A, partial [Chlamydia psittaci C1/97]